MKQSPIDPRASIAYDAAHQWEQSLGHHQATRVGLWQGCRRREGSFNMPTGKACCERLFGDLFTVQERRTLVVTTNLPFEQWTQTLGRERRLAEGDR